MATMLLGSFIAGATSEGGGAVAFPVMTLGLGIAPSEARDFSLMIQSIGMTSASLLILINRIPIASSVLLPVLFGCAAGLVTGFGLLENLFMPAAVKYFFTAVWLSFAYVLYRSHLQADRLRRLHLRGVTIPFGRFLFAGFLGGVVSSLVGSGADIIVFSVLTLYFGLCEKVATPTSVVIMAATSLMATALKVLVFASPSPETIERVWACAGVVVLGAPFGAWFIRYRTPAFIRGILYLSIGAQTIWAWIVLPKSVDLTLLFFLTLAGGLLFFTVVEKSRVSIPIRP